MSSVTTRPWSLAARLTAWYAGAGFVLLAGATGFLYWVLVTNLEREDDELLADKVQILRTLLRERPDNAQALRQEVEWEWAASEPARFHLRILDPRGRPLLESPGMSDLLPAGVFPEPGTGPAAGVDVEAAGGKAYRVLAARAETGPPQPAPRVLQVALDRTGEEKLLARYRTYLWLVLAGGLAASAAAGYHIARRGLRPVEAISRTAGRIRSTTLQERIDPAGLPAELSALAGTFNEMLDRLEESFNRLTQFSADIAHELRTPVNNLRGEAEVALGQARAPEEYREVLGSCLEECGRLARLIDSLLFLARAESPQRQIVREPVAVARELAAVVALYEGVAAEAGVALHAAADPELVAPLDRGLFQRAVGNLVANAIAHTPPGGTVRLSATRAGGSLQVDVADTGAGIPAEHVARVWDRFFRADAARSTEQGRVGLGLAIVRSIATLHGGTATLTSEVGHGTQIRLTFPAETAQ